VSWEPSVQVSIGTPALQGVLYTCIKGAPSGRPSAEPSPGPSAPPLDGPLFGPSAKAYVGPSTSAAAPGVIPTFIPSVVPSLSQVRLAVSRVAPSFNPSVLSSLTPPCLSGSDVHPSVGPSIVPIVLTPPSIWGSLWSRRCTNPAPTSCHASGPTPNPMYIPVSGSQLELSPRKRISAASSRVLPKNSPHPVPVLNL
jgi:hypothetical protein